jgi:esterase/lipase
VDSLEVETRQFTGKRAESEAALEGLSPISRAGLAQFSLERMTGYGVDYADAIELRARIIDGADWKEAGITLADEVLALAPQDASTASRINCLHRASALLRMSQMMMLDNSVERAEIFNRAAALYASAAALGLNRKRVVIEGPGGPLVGWLIGSTAQHSIGSAIIFGGIEGWAMDFDSMGDALAERGIDALMLDCPGQGETRFAHGHYLSTSWQDNISGVVDFLQAREPDRPIGIVGNSMGGSFAMSFAGADKRIVACCNNGGVMKPSMGRFVGGTFLAKMVAFCGTNDENLAIAIWDSVLPLQAEENPDYQLLVVQGGEDPLVPNEHAQVLLQMAPTRNKRMVLFSDGNHCIYNHRRDRDNLIADWMLDHFNPSPFRKI